MFPLPHYSQSKLRDLDHMSARLAMYSIAKLLSRVSRLITLEVSWKPAWKLSARSIRQQSEAGRNGASTRTTLDRTCVPLRLSAVHVNLCCISNYRLLRFNNPQSCFGLNRRTPISNLTAIHVRFLDENRARREQQL